MNMRLRSGELDATLRGAGALGDANRRVNMPGDEYRRAFTLDDAKDRAFASGDEKNRVNISGDEKNRAVAPGDEKRRAVAPGDEKSRANVPGDARRPAPPSLPNVKIRRAISKSFIILIIIFTLILLVSVTPIFSISEIKVDGNSYYDNSHIIASSGLRVGQNGFSALAGNNVIKMFTFRCASAEQAVASACPYIKTVQARYILPREIRIDVEERSKSFIVPYFGSGLLVDGEGVVVDIVKNYGDSELPVAQGLTVVGYEIGKSLAVGDDSRIDTVLSVINAVRQADRDSDEALAWNVDTIDISDLRNIFIAINNGISVNLGDGTELYYRVSAAKEIIARGIDEGSEGTIIFKNGARPVFVPGAA